MWVRTCFSRVEFLCVGGADRGAKASGVDFIHGAGRFCFSAACQGILSFILTILFHSLAAGKTVAKREQAAFKPALNPERCCD